MPTIYTGSYKIPFESGKGLGQIAQEKEAYTRGAEQARMDLQKQQIKNAQTERALARIDAEEKETRRQLEWDAVQKRQAEQFTLTQEGTQKRWEEMTPYQKSVEGRLKSAEQRKIDAQKKNEEMLRRVSLGESTFQQAGAEGGFDLRTQQPTVQQEQEPTPVQKSLQDQYYEGLKKQIKPIDANFKKRLRMKAISEENKPNRSAKQNEYAITSYYNTELKKAEKEYQDDVNAYNKAMLEKKQKEIKADKPREFTPIQKQKIKAVKANLKRSKSINKWGDTKTIASLDEALDYIISEKLSPELFTKELEKFARSEYNKLRASGVSAEEARRRLGL